MARVLFLAAACLLAAAQAATAGGSCVVSQAGRPKFMGTCQTKLTCDKLFTRNGVKARGYLTSCATPKNGGPKANHNKAATGGAFTAKGCTNKANGCCTRMDPLHASLAKPSVVSDGSKKADDAALDKGDNPTTNQVDRVYVARSVFGGVPIVEWAAQSALLLRTKPDQVGSDMKPKWFLLAYGVGQSGTQGGLPTKGNEVTVTQVPVTPHENSDINHADNTEFTACIKLPNVPVVCKAWYKQQNGYELKPSKSVASIKKVMVEKAVKKNGDKVCTGTKECPGYSTKDNNCHMAQKATRTALGLTVVDGVYTATGKETFAKLKIWAKEVNVNDGPGLPGQQRVKMVPIHDPTLTKSQQANKDAEKPAATPAATKADPAKDQPAKKKAKATKAAATTPAQKEYLKKGEGKLASDKQPSPTR